MLNVGWMTAAAGLWRQGEEDPGRPLRLPVPAYLVETEAERILIDTGLHPAAVADPVRQDDEKLRSIERLIFSKQLAGKFGANKLRAAAGRPVHDQNGICRFALGVFLWFSQRAVVNPQLRQRFP